MLAVDLPFVESRFLAYLIASACQCAAVVTVPRSQDGWQPLCAVYRREFAASAERALHKGKNRIDALFSQVETRAIGEEELVRMGFSPSNVSQPEYPRGMAKCQSGICGAGTRPRKLMSTDLQSGPYIEFKHVFKSFGENRVLDDVSFDVKDGETVCILGRSGVGKSVTLQNIMGFLKPDSGRVIVAHEDITDYTEEQMEHIRKKVTMVFQNGALFDSLTVGENVAFPLREHKGMTEEQIFQVVDGLLDMVGVKPMRDLLPSDLSTGHEAFRGYRASPGGAAGRRVPYDEPTTMVDPLMAQCLAI